MTGSRTPSGRPATDCARITVRVTPRGGRDAIDGWDGDVVRIRVAAAPAGGQANASVVRTMARAAGVPRSRVTIVSGASSRTKIIEVAGRSLAELRDRLSPRVDGD